MAKSQRGRPTKPASQRATKDVHLKVRPVDWDLWERAAQSSGAGSFSAWAKIVLTRVATEELGE